MECHGDYTLACEQCPKTFSSTSMLLAHRICHSEQRLFRCATCGKRFKTKYTLKCHDLSVHKNECPFHCPSCDQQFKRLSDFIVHKRKHTGERPFTCPICMRKFFTKSYMLRHAKKHSQSSENVAWREVVEGTIPVSEVVLPSQDLSCDIGVAEQVV
jgi:KRAB domain-containing zinc finger protein